MVMQISLWCADFISFEYISKSGIAGSYWQSIISLLRQFHTVLHNGYTHQQYVRIPFSPHSYKHLCFFFNIVAILTGVRCYLILILICISLMSNDIENLKYICWSFVFHPLRSVYSTHLSIFNLDYLVSCY
jgi:hypothetical protein